MTPVDLPYVPILLNETFITALWDTGAEKSFMSELVYRRYFSYRPRQKTNDIVTAEGAPCCHLGIDFMKEPKLTLDFDKKSLIIPDDQIKQLPKVEKPVEIDLPDTKLDQPGLTLVLYHEIDTGNQGPVVSRPYRYDRVKQGIIDYHIEKILQEGTIRPIQSPYASPVVLTRKNNGIPPDSPEAYRFAIDYRKLNAITKYPRYPLSVIDDLITNIPHIGRKCTNRPGEDLGCERLELYDGCSPAPEFLGRMHVLPEIREKFLNDRQTFSISCPRQNRNSSGRLIVITPLTSLRRTNICSNPGIS
ncbi:retrovirus-related Pol polyprotein from transposon 297 [Trichonephila clavipes]|nr:retrovirus-related Pol polyprotein from transposon 297 [Trichonephila clavipes]